MRLIFSATLVVIKLEVLVLGIGGRLSHPGDLRSRNGSSFQAQGGRTVYCDTDMRNPSSTLRLVLATAVATEHFS